MFALAFFLKFNGTKWSEISKKREKTKTKSGGKKETKIYFGSGGVMLCIINDY